MNGELYTCNPHKFDQQDVNVESELLKEVLNYGQLYFYKKDKLPVHRIQYEFDNLDFNFE